MAAVAGRTSARHGSGGTARRHVGLLARAVGGRRGELAGLVPRGIARWYDGDTAGAVEAWRASVRLQEARWALRNLGIAAGPGADAVDLYRRATALSPGLVVLVAGLLGSTAACSDGRLRLAEVRVRSRPETPREPKPSWSRASNCLESGTGGSAQRQAKRAAEVSVRPPLGLTCHYFGNCSVTAPVRPLCGRAPHKHYRDAAHVAEAASRG